MMFHCIAFAFVFVTGVCAYLEPSDVLPPHHDMNFMPQADPLDPYRYRHEAHLGSTQHPEVALRYDVKLAPHAVALSQIKSIHSIRCRPDSLILTVGDDFVATSGINTWKEDHILNGGLEFGCLDEYGKKTIVMRTMKSWEIDGNTVTIHTKGKAALEHFFEQADIAFYSIKGSRPRNFDEQMNNPKAGNVVNDDGSVTITEGGVESLIKGQKPLPVSAPTVPDFTPRGYNNNRRPQLQLKPQAIQAIRQQPGADFQTEAQTGSSVTVTSPVYKDSYKAGDTIALTWTYSGYSGATGVKVSLMKERWLVWDATIQELPAATMSTGATGLTTTVQTSWRASERYYFLLKWDCGWFTCSNQQSPYFLIPEIQITNPLGDSKFHPGDTVTVTWLSFGLAASTQLSMTVYQDKPMWPDAKLVKTTKTPNDGTENIVIPPETEIELWPYYVEFEWNCLIFGQFCDYAYSDRFSLPGHVEKDWNYDAYTGRALTEISMISLGCDNIVQACAGGAGTASVSPVDERTRKFRAMGILHEDDPMIAGAAFAELSSHDNNNLKRERNEIEKQANLPVSVAELFGPGSRNHQMSQSKFSSSSSSTAAQEDAARNLRVKRRKGESPSSLTTYVSLMNSYRQKQHVLDQDPCAPTGGDTGDASIGFPGGLLGEICKLCAGSSKDVGGTTITAQKTFDISLSCTNCWYKYEYTVAKFELIKSGTTVESLIVDLEGTAQVNIELMMTVHYRQTFGVQRRLIDIPLYGWGFNVAGIAVELGIFLSLDFKFDVTFDLTGRLSMEGGANAAFSGKLQYGTQYPAARLDSGHAFSYSTYKNKPKITIDASVVIRVSFIPMLRFSFFGILTLSIYIEPFVEWTSLFNWPGFPALSDAPEPLAIKKFAEDCTSPHYFQFLVTAGLGSLMLQAELDFKLPVLDKFHLVFQYAIPLPYDYVPLISGCWLKPKSVATTAVTIDGQANLDTESDQNVYEYQVQQEVANAVGVDQERVNIGQIDVDPNTDTTKVEVSFSSQLENGQGDPPSPVSGAIPFIPRIATMFAPFLSYGSAAGGASEAGYWATFASTGAMGPPVPDWTPDAPDTRSAQTLATMLKNAVANPNSVIRRPTSVLHGAQSVTAIQSYNPADGNTLSLASESSGLDGPSFGYGFMTFVLICVAGLFIYYANQRYQHAVRARNGGGGNSGGYIQLDRSAGVTHNNNRYSHSTSSKRGVVEETSSSGAGSYRPVELAPTPAPVAKPPARPSSPGRKQPSQSDLRSTTSSFRPISPVASSSTTSPKPSQPTAVRPLTRQGSQNSFTPARPASPKTAPAPVSPVHKKTGSQDWRPASPTHKKTGSQDLRPSSPQRSSSPTHKKTGSQDLRPSSPQRSSSPTHGKKPSGSSRPASPSHKKSSSNAFNSLVANFNAV